MARRPLLAIFHEASSVINVLKETNAGLWVTYGDTDRADTKVQEIKNRLLKLETMQVETNWDAFNRYSARSMTDRLANVFDRVTESNNIT